MSTSRYVEIRPDNVPADGKVSFKNGFPVLSFTVSAQDGLLDPASIRIVGKYAAFSDNATPTPTPAQDGDGLNMNSRLGIYNVFDQLTVRAARSKMICEQIRHYAKWFNTYTALTSSLGDQTSHLAESALIMPNSELFRKSVVESNAAGTKISSFSAHLPCGFCQSGNMVDLRATAFGGVQIEIQLTPDANALFFEGGTVPSGKGEAHYELSDLKLCCEVMELGETPPQPQGSFQFNTITSLYTSINSANAQIQYSLALKNLQSAFMTFMPVQNINTLTADGQATTFPSDSDASLAAVKRVQFLKGGVKFPAEFDYVNNFDAVNNPTNLPDSEIVKGLYDAIVPPYHQTRTSISPANMTRNYTMATSATEETAYNLIPQGGAVMGLGVKYGIGDSGEDFSTEQFGASIVSDLATDNPIGVFLFFKAKATLLYSQQGVQLLN